MIDPCISDKWDGFTVTRKFRGDTFHITVTNPDHVMKGVKSITCLLYTSPRPRD